MNIEIDSEYMIGEYYSLQSLDAIGIHFNSARNDIYNFKSQERIQTPQSSHHILIRWEESHKQGIDHEINTEHCRSVMFYFKLVWRETHTTILNFLFSTTFNKLHETWNILL